MKLRRTLSSSTGFFWLLLTVLALLSACTKPLPSEFTVTGRPLALDDSAALEVVARYRDRAERSQALRGLARVTLEGSDFKLNRPQRIAVARPSKLRFEVLGLFDVLAAMLISDGEEFAFFDAGTGEITRGPVTPALLWEFAQLDLEPDEVVGLLMGFPLPSSTTVVTGIWLEDDAGVTVAFSPTDEVGRVQCDAGFDDTARGAPTARPDCASGTFAYAVEVFRFDAAGLLREMRSMDSGWTTRYSASYESYEESVGADASQIFPMRITLRSPRVDSLARFEWKRVMLTEELPDRLFEMPGESGSGG